MFRTLSSLFRERHLDETQLALALDTPPRTAEELLLRLRRHGLKNFDTLRLTRNRTVMVSFQGRELRMHEGYLAAPPDVLRAVVIFIQGRTRTERSLARNVVLAFRIPVPPPRRRSTDHPADAAAVARLAEWHARFNAQHFNGKLQTIPIRLSRRMKSRLGHYSAATPAGESAEIAISRRHLRRDGWSEALHTLLHEMVHQWQDELGHPIDHGRAFRRKAREVGIIAAARRPPRAGDFDLLQRSASA